MPVIAVWQCAPTPNDPEDNLQRLGEAARSARRRGAHLLVTPELTLTGYDVGRLPSAAGHLDLVREVAAQSGLAVVVGLAEQDGSGAATNSSVIVSASGEVLARYDKAHLFGELDRSRFRAGDTLFAQAEVAGLQVATMICYDVEFPEPVRAAALAGADLVAVPTANMEPFGIVSDLIIPCRAWENQVWVAYANHCGQEGETVYVGRSVVAGPDGRPAAQAGQDEELVLAEVDPRTVADGRAANPYLRDRRPDLYAALTQEDT